MALKLGLLRIFSLVLFLLMLVEEVRGKKKVFNVMNYGARPDGETDNTEAFYTAWNQSCQNEGQSVIYIPKGTFKLGPIILKGQCKGPINFRIIGVLKAPTEEALRHLDHWITFRYIDQLTIDGGGTLDGQGPFAWPYNNCSTQHCKPLPVTMRFDFVTNSLINNIKSINSKNFHFNIFACSNIKIHHVKIQAPKNSPNTDGIHIASSDHISILDSNIGTGDDCISMGPGSKNISISRVRCGPGHGISIGSLGGSPNEDDVAGITVKNCTISNTMNGVRIKTWGHSYPVNVYDLSFEDIHLNNVDNPIIIDQEYCPSHHCSQESSKVKIRDVKFWNIWGTTRSNVVVNLKCSQSTPCENIELKDINTSFIGRGQPSSHCSNVQGVAYGLQQPPSCLRGL